MFDAKSRGAPLSLVQIARFADLHEAQVAASLLRSEGILPFLPEEYRGSTDFFLWQAMGGFRLLVVEEEAEAALALIRPFRKSDPEAMNWTAHPEARSAALPSVFWAIFEPSGGLALAQLRRGRRPMAIAMLAIACVSVAALFISALVGLLG